MLHASTPVSSVQARLRRQLKTPRYVAALNDPVSRAGVRDLVPKQILPPRLGIGRQTEAWVSAELSERGVAQVVILVDQPLFVHTAERLRRTFGPETLIIYRPTDIHPRGALARAEHRLIQVADAVIATSQITLDTVLKQTDARPGLRTFVLENGVDCAMFESIELSANERCGFVYVGAIDDRFDWDAVIAIANAYPQEKITLVGPVTVGRNSLPPNVLCTGAVPYLETPGVLSRARVGLLPFNSNSLNAGRSPMKFYEYLSAGLAVAGTRTSELKNRDAPRVWLWDHEENPADQAGRALADVWSSAGVRHARAFDWHARSRDLMAIIDDVYDSQLGRRHP
ncbi:glycosyltransferase [Rhodococcus sp. NBC_00294]|uniref:glycosyltransferase n=1 Tax=Rhodococcus sp. NBC_00294 TaxID=2976004 RepID=UPI002E2A6C08|nr:hypothetical protein [Rhodococcus sp. NBC_00294]